MAGLNLKRSNIFINYVEWENPLVNAILDLVKQDKDAIRRLMNSPAVQDDSILNCLSATEFKENLTAKQLFSFIYAALKETAENCRCIFQGIENWEYYKIDAMVFHQFTWGTHNSTADFEQMEQWVLQFFSIFFERRIEIIPCCATPIYKTQVQGEEHKRVYYIFAIRAVLDSVYISTTQNF